MKKRAQRVQWRWPICGREARHDRNCIPNPPFCPFCAASMTTEVDRQSKVEKDPHGKDPHAPGAKLDDGKVMAGLIAQFGLALLEVAKVGTYGAKKYTRGGWQHVENGVERYTDAMWRHLLASNHEQFDESGMEHLTQVLWNLLAATELKLREKGKKT